MCSRVRRRVLAAPDASRETLFWFTLVDLDEHNPINGVAGGELTPQSPADSRPAHVVQGELTCPADPVRESGDPAEPQHRRL